MFLGGKEQKRNPKLESVQKTAHSLQEKKCHFPESTNNCSKSAIKMLELQSVYNNIHAVIVNSEFVFSFCMPSIFSTLTDFSPIQC